MKTLVKFLIFLIFFSFSTFKSEASGRDVVILLKDSTEVKGELLSVRDSLMAIAVEPISQDEDIAAHPEHVVIVKFSELYKVHILKNNFLLTGSLIGGGISALNLLIIKNGSGSGLNIGKGVPFLPFILGGGIIGMGIGYLASDNEEVVTFISSVKDNEKLILLKKISRFKDSEPSYLRDTIDNLLKETK
ncbi:MAG: hypothetical protein V4642_10490 [Bacteroidota bacterium]